KPDWQPQKINVQGDLVATEHVHVRFSDLDLYHHVNNTSYIRWVENFAADRGVFPSNLSINYLSECVAGEVVGLQFFQSGSGNWISGQVNGKKVFLAHFF
ncbi:MAG: hypothetical protein B7Z16_09780, partial [Algoriphagus sp. 32-45-6]